MASPMRVLLIEDDPEHAELIRSHISRKHGSAVEIQWTNRLSLGLEHLAKNNLDIILLDLGLPDSTVDETLSRVLSKAHGLPIVVLSSLEDEDFGMKAVHQGAQDYICKSWMDGELLFRSLRYAIERKNTEEELRKANRAKDEFLATLSHELRAPINVIHGFAEILNRDNLTKEEQRQALEAILRNSKVQVALIDDMLDVSRIITGKLTLQSMQSTAQDLVSIINNAIQAVNLAAQTKEITLKTSFEPFSGMIHGDPVRLHQILWNLLSNAIKFTPSGGSVEVRLRNADTYVEIDIEDTGEGILPEFLPYVFDRFSQQDSSIRRHYGGLGLGLAIVRHLVELHGGKTSVKSEGSGKGATFTISFPIVKAQIDAATPLTCDLLTSNSLTSQKNPPSLKEPSRPLEGMHVLAIDDSPDSLILTRALLQRSGAIVTTAGSATEARTVLSKANPDVIISDIGMPEEDGYTFLRKLRAAETATGQKHVPAAALTAYTREEERKEALQSGFQAHLSKPIEEKALIKTLTELTSLHGPHLENS